MNHAQFWGGAAAPYEIEQSLRFDGSSYMDPPDDVFGNEIGTYSFWVKRSELGAENTILWNKRAGDNHWGFRFDGANTFTLFKTAGGVDSSTTTTAVFRDPSAWYHILVTTTSTTNEVFVNGTSVATGSYEWAWIDANPRIGYRSSTDSFQGYLAEWHYISGSVKSVSDFTETDDNGVLRPIEYTGSYGTRGYYLKFDPSLTNGILHDSSGQGNHFDSSTGFTTSGTGTDVMSDTPTTNWCTLNPLETPAFGTLGNGNLELTASSNLLYRLATIQIPSSSTNKFYWEVKYEGGPNYGIGIKRHLPGGTEYGDTIRLQETNGQNAEINGSNVFSSFTTDTAPSTTTAAGDVIGVAYDPSAGTIKWTKNGSTFGEASGLASADVVPFVGRASSTGSQTSKFIVNFGQRDFEYTPPTNYVALNTSNLPAPDIADGSDYFNTVLYTGNDSNPRSFTDLKWKPDFVWIKIRSQAYYGGIFDSVRGAGGSKRLYPSENFAEGGTTGAEGTFYGALTSFDNFGFTVDTGSTSDIWVNDNNETYVAWNWLANGSGSSNTDGSITSTVSANPTAGFSIASYTGNGTSGATVGHGLGVKPSLLIVRRRPTASNWTIYHSSVGATKRLILDLDYAAQTGSGWWNNTEPTSTVFTIGNDGGTNSTTNNTYIAYCFAEVEGYSKFGKYVSNNSADGPFVFCGFKPELVWLKKTSATSNWFMYDAARNEYNVTGNKLYADSSAAENGEDGGSTTSNTIDILSNGFKLRTNNGTNNGGDYIFCAWAQHPFGGSDVSPATAR